MKLRSGRDAVVAVVSSLTTGRRGPENTREAFSFHGDPNQQKQHVQQHLVDPSLQSSSCQQLGLHPSHLRHGYYPFLTEQILRISEIQKEISRLQVERLFRLITLLSHVLEYKHCIKSLSD